MSLANCTREEAERMLRECNNDPVEAVDRLIETPKTLGAPKKKQVSDEQKWFSEIRKTMENIDNNIEKGLKKKDQLDDSSCLEQCYTHTLHSQQPLSGSIHTLQNQITIPELKEQTQGTVYQ